MATDWDRLGVYLALALWTLVFWLGIACGIVALVRR